MARTPSDLLERIRDAAARAEAAQHETIAFDDYLDRVHQRPSIAASAHDRVHAMLERAGWRPGPHEHDAPASLFFEDQVFGLERPIAELARLFESAANGLETRRRILLLWGPPGGAKSTIATLIKRGLEASSRTDEGAVFAIKGCPMHEEPLKLLPEIGPGAERLRDAFATSAGVRIEGVLCPLCRFRLEHEFGGDFTRFPVERIYFSEAERVGIGTFAPSDPKSMSMEMLTGGINFRALEQHGSDADPRVLDWAGEFTRANRGMLEAIEFFKNPREFLYGFLTLAQERNFKVPKFGLVDADMVVLAHTNEAEFRAFMNDPKNEALRDRLITISVPYTLRVGEERRIHEKLLRGSRSGIHVDPHTTEVAAMVAVLTRLAEHPSLGPVDKMRLYDGQEVGDWSLNQVPEVQRAAPREGMEGIGPRFVIDRLSEAAADQAKGGEEPALTPIVALRALRAGIEHVPGVSDETRKAWLAHLTDARREMDRILKDEVRKAFIPAFADRAQALLENYLANCEAHCQRERLRDPITGEEVDPDEGLMRRVEEQIGVSANAKEQFRQGVLVRIGITLRHGRPLTYRSDDQLGRAIESHLFEEMKDIVRITVSKTNPDPDQARRLNEVIRVLVDDHGYTEKTASDLLDYVGALLAR